MKLTDKITRSSTISVFSSMFLHSSSLLRLKDSTILKDSSFISHNLSSQCLWWQCYTFLLLHFLSYNPSSCFLQPFFTMPSYCQLHSFSESKMNPDLVKYGNIECGVSQTRYIIEILQVCTSIGYYLAK